MPVATATQATMMNQIVGSGTQTIYVQLHTASPAADGTTNVASNNTRQSCSIALVVASGGTSTRTSSSDAAWSSGNVNASETYSYISVWSAASSGTCYMWGALTSPVAVTSGNTFTIPSGSLVLSLT